MKKLLVSVAMSAAVAVAALAAGTTSASAAIVCNRAGDCWHTTDRYSYRPSFGLNIHPDNWAWRTAEANRYRWREHTGRGYWRGGVWVTF